ncbi:TIGR02453 family protein [uncultured Shimia sp.]|uniref:TIGR02453 family protein n=1 Tax=uncultured Shimia sp. TaxID=573152 RepID=UPI002622C827|nr:TIGR02453 family protein [uncultured Shimia sp.]
MTDTFDTLVPDARRFLGDLSASNNREWFTANKSYYEADLKAPALAFLDVVGARLEKMTGAPVETKLFRPHRDVRFSKDKTPYHTHLHMLWSQGGLNWFFGVAPDYISVGAGVFGFDKDALVRWREAADSNGGAIAAMIATLTDNGARLGEPELKRVPAPFDKDHPHGALLRRKGLTLWFDTDEAALKKGGLTAWVETAFSELLPVQTALRSLL